MSGAARYAVVGHPVEHSQSPFIHAEFARQTGEKLVYTTLDCPLDGFAPTLQRYAASGASGCNVTLPFKGEAFALAMRTTSRARLAGACNTLRVDADGWFGDNTDGVGLVRDLVDGAGFDLPGKQVLLLGAGGAAAGVLGPLAESGVARIVVANRSVERAAALVDRHRGRVAVAATAAIEASDLDGCGAGFDLVINATASSVAGAPVPVAAHVLGAGALAVDLMYGPAAAPFVAWAEANGGQGRDGLGMLVEQAAESFFLWRGVRPRTGPVLAALRQRLEGSR